VDIYSFFGSTHLLGVLILKVRSISIFYGNQKREFLDRISKDRGAAKPNTRLLYTCL